MRTFYHGIKILKLILRNQKPSKTNKKPEKSQIRKAEEFYEQENETLQQHSEWNRIIKLAKRDNDARIELC